MNDKTWKLIKYWKSKYTWPVSALVGSEYSNDKEKNERRKRNNNKSKKNKV